MMFQDCIETWLICSSDAIEKVWIGLTDLDEVFAYCDYVLLLLICETVWNRLCVYHPFCYMLMKNLIIHLVNVQLASVSGLQPPVHKLWLLPTPRIIFKVLFFSEYFKAFQDTCKTELHFCTQWQSLCMSFLSVHVFHRFGYKAKAHSIMVYKGMGGGGRGITLSILQPCC